MNRIARLALAPLLSLAVLPAAAQDPVRGQALYETHCIACHYERIHKRDPSRSLVKSMAELRSEVATRAGMTGRAFTTEEIDEIAEYLNRTHYRFRQ